MVAVDDGLWWWSTTDSSGSGNVGQRRRMTEMVADGGRQWHDGGSDDSKQWGEGDYQSLINIV